MNALDLAFGVTTAGAALLLCVPITHKVRLVRSGSVLADPLIRSRPWLARHAIAWICIATAAEMTVTVALVVIPAVGALGLAALCVVYTTQLAQLGGDGSCQCFGGTTAPTPRAKAIRRNNLIAVSGVAIGAVGIAGVAQAADQSLAVALAALILSPFAGRIMLGVTTRAGGHSENARRGA
jgi:hypothetical protein